MGTKDYETSGNAAHDLTVHLSKLQLRQDQANANATAGVVVIGQPPVNPANLATWRAALKAADVAHLTRVVTSGRVNNVQVTSELSALRELGAPVAS
jgi:hypothetical protein